MEMAVALVNTAVLWRGEAHAQVTWQHVPGGSQAHRDDRPNEQPNALGCQDGQEDRGPVAKECTSRVLQAAHEVHNHNKDLQQERVACQPSEKW